MVRAKFVVSQITRYHNSPNAVTVKMQPVYGNTEENKTFWQATPSGSIEMSITAEPAAKAFELGKEYYVDFILASEDKE